MIRSPRCGQSLTAALPSLVVRNEPVVRPGGWKVNGNGYLQSITLRAHWLRLQDAMSDNASILVVDDEPHVSEMLQDFLLELGYTVDLATTGGEALSRASSKRPDAVILDMRLPDTTGDQLFTKLRALDGSLSIVIVSGDADGDVARRTVAAGAFQYLQKPFDFDVLQQTITRAVLAGREHHAPEEPGCVTR